MDCILHPRISDKQQQKKVMMSGKQAFGQELNNWSCPFQSQQSYKFDHSALVQQPIDWLYSESDRNEQPELCGSEFTIIMCSSISAVYSQDLSNNTFDVSVAPLWLSTLQSLETLYAFSVCLSFYLCCRGSCSGVAMVEELVVTGSRVVAVEEVLVIVVGWWCIGNEIVAWWCWDGLALEVVAMATMMTATRGGGSGSGVVEMVPMRWLWRWCDNDNVVVVVVVFVREVTT
ncbi:hypothetical protein Ancab_026472 [Ancistrocladus abbreviatus]